MTQNDGTVVEIRLDAGGQSGALIECPAGMAPAPGQYVQAHASQDEDAALGYALFAGGLNHPVGVNQHGKVQWLSAPGIPASWQPGSRLRLRGPLGHGFVVPASTRRLGLAAFGDSAARLLPLIERALRDKVEVAIFSEAALPQLPNEVEANSLSALAEAHDWPDFLAMDIPLEKLATLREQLGLAPDARLPYRAQVLIHSAMPCAGLADCGVCALPAMRKLKLACKHGPVFDLKETGF